MDDSTNAKSGAPNERGPRLLKEQEQAECPEDILPQQESDFSACACFAEDAPGPLAPACDDLGHRAFRADKAAKRNRALALVAAFAIRNGAGFLSAEEGIAIAAHTRRSGIARRRGDRP